MNALTVLYHDIVEGDDDTSGFPGEAAARYKISRDEFQRHLAQIVRRSGRAAVAPTRAALAQGGTAFFVTVDDGGISALAFAEETERVGFRAAFFVTTDMIGKPGFVSAEDIRALAGRGHAIGSHSHTHPYRFSELPAARIAQEWRGSVDILAGILGSPVTTASVPGGYFSRGVAQAAAAAGIEILFNSEPTTAVSEVEGCLVLGRFNVYRGMSAEAAGALAGGDRGALLRQQVSWNAKKAVKRAAAPVWEGARRIVFRR